MQICFIGIGLMGQPMVERLINAGFNLTLWNRSPEKMEGFRDTATIAESVRSGLENADIIITMLESGPIVQEVLFESGAFQAIKKGALVIDMSSIPPATARQHAANLAAYEVDYLDAPVSGGTLGAQEGTLSIMAGGTAKSFERAKTLFDHFGTATHIGVHGTGQLTKLANQAVVGITIGAVSEALLLASKGGANPAAVRQALSGGFAGSKILEQHGLRMIERNFEPGAKSRVQLKDMQTIINEAHNEGLTLPLAEKTLEAYRSHVAHGNEEKDHSSLLIELERLNGTKLS